MLCYRSMGPSANVLYVRSKPSQALQATGTEHRTQVINMPRLMSAAFAPPHTRSVFVRRGGDDSLCAPSRHAMRFRLGVALWRVLLG